LHLTPVAIDLHFRTYQLRLGCTWLDSDRNTWQRAYGPPACGLDCRHQSYQRPIRRVRSSYPIPDRTEEWDHRPQAAPPTLGSHSRRRGLQCHANWTRCDGRHLLCHHHNGALLLGEGTPTSSRLAYSSEDARARTARRYPQISQL
jgi:hypothetical protein